jgi:hypothetical protein
MPNKSIPKSQSLESAFSINVYFGAMSHSDSNETFTASAA